MSEAGATAKSHDRKGKSPMGWKYIMFENKIGDTTVIFPVIFPDKMVHDDVAQALRRYQPGWHHDGVRPISAGKIEHVNVEGLGGDSETLKLKSKPFDEKIIELYSYLHGVI
jgi:hypothetical protein